jgi:integrase
VAQQKATQIELDIASGNFDETLKKYKPPKAAAKKREETTVTGLFEKFTARAISFSREAKDARVSGQFQWF